MRSKPIQDRCIVSTHPYASLCASLFIGLSACLSTGLTGCYTQLLTRGYGEQTRNSETQYAKQPQTSGDTLAPTEHSTTDVAVAENDSTANPSVIVNNYYDRDATYRGYSNFDWDYPLLSFSFYSSRYRSYSDPYWWHSSGSYRDRYYRYYDQPRYGHHHHQNHNYYNNGNGNGNGNSSPGNATGNSKYQSEQRIFTPPPHYPQAQKGRRSGAAEPAQKSSPAPTQISAPSVSDPAPTSTQTPPRPISHPKLEKGKRR